MSRSRDPFPIHHGRHALLPETLATAKQLLVTHWDPDGALRRMLATRPAGPDATRPRSLDDAAREACGILAAGGPEAQVSGYLKREELAVLGPPDGEAEQVARRERRQRAAIALWRLVRGIPHPSDWERPPGTPARGE
jgi:hypothetical protein